MAKEKIAAPPEQKHELRREVSVWGSYMWGYADVGANTFVALGLVMAYAQGAASLVFAIAGLTYVLIGLAYTELASTYPVSGGGPYYTLRSLGDFWGFVAGSGLLLAYTIDIALFAVASAGYLNFFMPYVLGKEIEQFVIAFGPFQVNWLWGCETLFLILILIWLNIKGIKESSFLNEVIGIIVIVLESSLIVLGLIFAWKPELLASQWINQFPTFKSFTYSVSLAIISFIGLESISQAAQETKRPATIIPRTSLALTFSVFIFAVSFSTLGLGVLPWQRFAENVDNPLAVLASSFPLVGLIAGPLTAALGALILFISSNTGIMGASRLTYSFSQYGIISSWFGQVHRKYRTPVRTILVFSLIGIVQTILSFLTPSVMETLAIMYAFGATLGYTLVFIALIKLRFSDPYSPRPYKIPLNLNFKYKTLKVQFPILALVGMLAVGTIFSQIILTNKIGRIAGPLWVIACFVYYAWYRKKEGLPVFRSAKHDWEKEQIEVLTSAEEFDLLEQYKNSLAERDKKRVRLK
ncbi:MAG: hypothetical protein RBG1_1C00001G1711 [candidate division Zixibacteria bacterium RBG-1]|nr:MAG: hypothetical protein RBG1_1C00001G1711 [candidate division Zixibacteria bacterium RBG-1]